MKLFVIVLCYRVVDLTIDCLESLSKEVGSVPDTKVGVLENGTGGDAAGPSQQSHRAERLGVVVRTQCRPSQYRVLRG